MNSFARTTHFLTLCNTRQAVRIFCSDQNANCLPSRHTRLVCAEMPQKAVSHSIRDEIASSHEILLRPRLELLSLRDLLESLHDVCHSIFRLTLDFCSTTFPGRVLLFFNGVTLFDVRPRFLILDLGVPCSRCVSLLCHRWWLYYSPIGTMAICLGLWL